MELSLFEEVKVGRVSSDGQERHSFHPFEPYGDHVSTVDTIFLYIFPPPVFTSKIYPRRSTTFHTRVVKNLPSIVRVRIERERKKLEERSWVTKLICGLENSQNCKYQFFFSLCLNHDFVRSATIGDRLIHNIGWFSFLFPFIIRPYFPHTSPGKPVGLSVRLSFHLAKPVFCIPLTAACDWISDFINS